MSRVQTRHLPPLREVIARHGLSASKALGQNFLLDEQLLDRIARVPGNLDGESVYEVGPGPGEPDIGLAVARVDRQRRFEQIGRFAIATLRGQPLGLLGQGRRARVDLGVGTLP